MLKELSALRIAELAQILLTLTVASSASPGSSYQWLLLAPGTALEYVITLLVQIHSALGQTGTNVDSSRYVRLDTQLMEQNAGLIVPKENGGRVIILAVCLRSGTRPLDAL